MGDRELLELAARAVGKTNWQSLVAKSMYGRCDQEGVPYWNPLTDDGDALRLAVKLGLTTGIEYGRKYAHCSGYKVPIQSDGCAAMRRAIVRAAAEIGSATTQTESEKT